MIPKIIHYVWCGSPFPDAYKAFIESWQHHNPSYDFILWNESNIDFSEPLMAECYRRKQYQKVSDLVRLKMILQMGGIYLDTDFLVVKPLDRLLEYRCFYGFQHRSHPTDLVANGAFGAEPNHWFVRKVLDRALISRNTIVGIDVPTAMGPKLVTRLLREEGLCTYSDAGVFVKDIFVAPTHWFYPFSMTEHFTPECLTEDTLMAHFWEKSWDKYVSPQTRLIRHLRALLRRCSGMPEPVAIPRRRDVL